jgi:uncharacterized protein
MANIVPIGDPWIVEQRWDLTYRHTADAATALFFRTLRDEARFVGTRCRSCDRVLVPPRQVCDRDFREVDEIVDVGSFGVIELFTIVYHKIQGLPEPPYAIAYVRLDGADTALVNFVRGVDLSRPDVAAAQLAIGTRVEACFAEERSGRMTEFWFQVVTQEDDPLKSGRRATV